MGKVICITAPPAGGKEQPLTSKVLTPTGYVTMGSLKVGQSVSSPTGHASKVLDVFPQGCKEVYEMVFDADEVVECGKNHLWRVEIRIRGKIEKGVYSTQTLQRIRKSYGDNVKISIMPTESNSAPRQSKLDFNAYTMGIIVGSVQEAYSIKDSTQVPNGNLMLEFDRSSAKGIRKRITLYKKLQIKTPERACNLMHLNDAGKTQLKLLGITTVKQDRFIPENYLQGTTLQKVYLLRGLMDTMGSVAPRGAAYFTTHSKKLMNQVAELARIIGCKIGKVSTDRRYAHPVYKVLIKSATFNLFASEVGFKRSKPKDMTRVLVDIVQTGKYVEQQCITVSDPNQMYVTDHGIATHNTTSLRYLKGKTAYLNLDAGKPLTFDNPNFSSVVITDAQEIFSGLQDASDAGYDTAIVDTLNNAFDLYELDYVQGTADTQKSWGNYLNWGKTLFSKILPDLKCNVIFLAHTYNIVSDEGVIEKRIPVAGRLAKVGLENYFTHITSVKRMTLAALDKYFKSIEQEPSELFNITPREKMLGFKYVFQTQITRDTIDEFMRSPPDMWALNETFIDPDCQAVFDRIETFTKGIK